ncbi:MAG TPA: YceI family protein, partial [Chitinophagaceae bacterium]|nr:YceI family protein [Chitinophagaceae bacterium]
MKKVLFSALAIACFTALYSFVPGIKTLVTDDYKVNTEHSKIDWVGSKKEGYHPGTFMLKSGNVNVENGRITKGQFVIDMANLKVTDKAGVKLEGHLKADDFFDVTKHPEAIFEIENVNY